MSALNLSALSFGAPAAERDSDLLRCFVGSDAYARIRDRGRNVILGNRGTGKSAIFKKLAEDEKKNGKIVVSLAPDDFSYEMMNRVLEKESKGAWAKHGAYSAAWKFLLYVRAFRELTQEGAKLKLGDAAKIYNYIRDNYADVERNPIGLLISYLKRLEGVKLGKWEAALKTRELDRLYKLEEIEPLIAVIDNVAKKHPVIILIDELDKGWDASEDAVAFVSGLFHAAMSVNSRHENIRVILSLRRELYDNIPAIYDDAQKFRDAIEIIHWDEDLLLELVGRRIGNALEPLARLEYRAQWNSVFAETLDYRKAKSFNYILDRTLFRPREIIQFCNDVVKAAVGNAARAPLNYDSIAEAESQYSEVRMHDIAAEYRHQFPGLNGIFETFRGLKFNMSKEAFEEHLIAIGCGKFKIQKESEWFKNLSPDEMIKILWEVGFLRVQAVGGIKAQRRSGSEWLGSHQISGLNIYDMPAYQVHPMFRSFLGMKENKGTSH